MKGEGCGYSACQEVSNAESPSSKRKNGKTTSIGGHCSRARGRRRGKVLLQYQTSSRRLVSQLSITRSDQSRRYVTGGVPPEYIGDLLYPNASTEENEPYLPHYQYLLAEKDEDLPYVISNSYDDHENTIPEYYARRVCNMIGMLGLRGRNILHSSGDEGVGAVCRSNTGDMQPQFSPQFPGESSRTCSEVYHDSPADIEAYVCSQ